MDKKTKFVIGGLLVALILLFGNLFLSNLIAEKGPTMAIVFLIVVFILISMLGLKLIADSLIGK
ncbi:MAG: hypothetical protein Q8N63_06245 [Nanoarchaeota archaeon]|nr:hypothetical protein [Nanoarchaeota archaeon]